MMCVPSFRDLRVGPRATKGSSPASSDRTGPFQIGVFKASWTVFSSHIQMLNTRAVHRCAVTSSIAVVTCSSIVVMR